MSININGLFRVVHFFILSIIKLVPGSPNCSHCISFVFILTMWYHYQQRRKKKKKKTILFILYLSILCIIVCFVYIFVINLFLVNNSIVFNNDDDDDWMIYDYQIMMMVINIMWSTTTNILKWTTIEERMNEWMNDALHLHWFDIQHMNEWTEKKPPKKDVKVHRTSRSMKQQQQLLLLLPSILYNISPYKFKEQQQEKTRSQPWWQVSS